MSRNTNIIGSLLVLSIAPALAANDSVNHDRRVPRDGANPSDVPVLTAPVQTFSGNSGERYYSIDVTSKGELARFDSPLGVPLLYSSGTDNYSLEGYALHYDDPLEEWTYESPVDWDPPVVTDLSPLTIVRTTEDGRMQLTQQFKADKTEIDFTITMVLKNISDEALTNVHLCRFAEVADLQPNPLSENWGSSSEYGAYSVWNRGVVLEGMTTVEPPRTWRTHIMWGVGFDSECVAGGDFGGGPSEDLAWYPHVVYKLRTMKSRETQTLKFRYRRL